MPLFDRVYVQVPATGDIYQSFQDGLTQICDYSHSLRGNLYVKKRNKSSLVLVCAWQEKGCPFEAAAAFDQRRLEYILRRFNGTHTCLGLGQAARGTCHSVDYFESKVSDLSH